VTRAQYVNACPRPTTQELRQSFALTDELAFDASLAAMMAAVVAGGKPAGAGQV
jgi:hypothetical protein